MSVFATIIFVVYRGLVLYWQNQKMATSSEGRVWMSCHSFQSLDESRGHSILQRKFSSAEGKTSPSGRISNEGNTSFSWRISAEGNASFLGRMHCISGDAEDYRWRKWILQGCIFAEGYASFSAEEMHPSRMHFRWRKCISSSPLTFLCNLVLTLSLALLSSSSPLLSSSP